MIAAVLAAALTTASIPQGGVEVPMPLSAHEPVVEARGKLQPEGPQPGAVDGLDDGGDALHAAGKHGLDRMVDAAS